MVLKIDHLGIAVKSIEETLKFYTEALGLQLGHIEEVPAQKVKVAMIPVGESKVELLEPTAEDSTIAKHIETRGEGLAHVALTVDNIEEALAQAKAAGCRLINETPVIGAGGIKVAFIHPKSSFGVLIELCEKH